MVATAKGDHEHRQVDRSSKKMFCFAAVAVSVRRIKALKEKKLASHATPR